MSEKVAVRHDRQIIEKVTRYGKAAADGVRNLAVLRA